MCDTAIWSSEVRLCAGLDPAYSAGGDRCILTTATYGTMKNGRFGIQFSEPDRIELSVDGEMPMAYMICKQVADIMRVRGVAGDALAVDCTGVQGTIADIFEKEYGWHVHRINFGGKPTMLPVRVGSIERANDRYKNRVTELWFNILEYGRFGHIRGLPSSAIVELTQRQIKSAIPPMLIEAKTEMKVRTKQSPDIADSIACLIAYIRERVGVTPGEGTLAENVEQEREMHEEDLDGDDSNYLIESYSEERI